MSFGQRLIPIKINLDLAADYFDPSYARFIKNLTTTVGATNDYAGITEGQNQLKLKPLQSNELYVPIALPLGDNFCIGAKGFPQTNEVYVWVWNSLNNHSIYRINGKDRTHQMVKIDPCFNFQLKPEHFVGDCQTVLKLIALTNPVTNEKFFRKELYWVDGFNYNGFLAVDDSIATNGFDPTQFIYFVGNYDPCIYTRAGIATPKDCVNITEIQRTEDEIGLNNNLLFQKWFFIVRRTDVWGRVSEWGARSAEYIPGINDCISGSNNLPRCLDLEFDAGDPTINTIEIGWYNCDTTVWHKETTLFMYKESNIGEWWLRNRNIPNPDFTFDPVANKIKYRFCRDKECDPIPVDETNRLQNPMPINSQSVIELNKNLGYLNNEDGFNPFPKSLLDQITVNVIPPTSVNSELRNITIYVVIGNWNTGGKPYGFVSKKGTKYGFGNFASTVNDVTLFQQFFANPEQTGFVGYLVGGGLAVSTQVYVDDITGEIIDDTKLKGTKLSPNKQFSAQKFVFNNVPKGTYVFRIASHLKDPDIDADFEKSSTTMWGKCFFDNALFRADPHKSIRSDTRGDYYSQELLIDVCDGDYDTLNQNEILVIADLTNFPADTSPYYAWFGYIHETLDKYGKPAIPMELMAVRVHPFDFYGETSLITDHNGFYWVITSSNTDFTFYFMNKCVQQQFTLGDGQIEGAVQLDFIIDQRPGFSEFATMGCNRVLIHGQILLNGTQIGVSNLNVVLTRGGSATTDDDGNFTIIAHDEILAIGGVRIDKLIMAGTGCGYTGVGDSCIATPLVAIIKSECDPITCPLRELFFEEGVLVLEYKTEKSLLSGGVYPLTLWGFDWLGRATFAQPLPYIRIPSITQAQAIGASQVQVIIPPSVTFPPDIKYLSFGIGEETTTAKYLDWIVDRVEYIGSDGEPTNINPTQIKIYYGSLNEFNSLNNFNTTVNWQFIPEGKNTPAISDKVQFFLNGDGKFFTKTIIGLVKYDQEGQFFLIDYTDELKNLKQNALIRLIRPKTCVGTEPLFEICGFIDVINGKAQQNTIILNAFDTYYLPRVIPVPAPVSESPIVSTTITTTETTNNDDGSTSKSEATTSAPNPIDTVTGIRIFGFRFEHAAPSNFWGDGCNFVGRINVKNPYEVRLRHLWQIALSGAVSINGQLNYLQYFEAKKKTDFDVPTAAGGITGAIAEVGQVFNICAYDCYLVGYNDNLGRVNENGTFQAPSIPNEFGKPQRKQGDTYGCQLVDKNTIRSRNGLIMWLDASRGELVQSNFSQVTSITKDETLMQNGMKQGKCDAWMRKKIRQVRSSPGSYFVGYIDPIANKYLLTVFSLTDKSYINQERTYGAKLNETVAFDIQTRELNQFWSFTPEYAAFLEGDLLSVQMFTFKGALPYSHYNVNTNNSYNTFYGVKCESVYRVIYNQDTFKKKILDSMSVYCENKKFFADQILTDSKQQSRVLMDWWEKADYFYYAPFLCDLNTLPDPNLPVQTGINKLTDGDKLYGSWVDIRFVGDPSKNDQYCEILGIIVECQPSEKSGIDQK